MKVGDLSYFDLRRHLTGEGLKIQTGCLTARILSPLEQVAKGIRLLYADYDVETEREFSNCHVRITAAAGLRHFFPNPTRMIVNGAEWYRTERGLQIASLEWALNWFAFRHAHHLLVIHAGTLERHGVGLIMPAHSGSGKSTLTAALAHSGWRLFSDELALIQPETGDLLPLARPICLKGDSIAAIRDFAPQAQFGPVVYQRKERRPIGHVKPPTDSVERMHEPASPGLVLFPQYTPGRETVLTPIAKSDSFIRVAQKSFNYSKLHRTGFDTLRNMIDQCQAYELTYSHLPEAVELVNQLASEAAPLVSHA